MVMYISLFSGGISSFESTCRLLDEFPNETRIWFFDTKIEDQDTYRFIKDCEVLFNMKIEIYSDGRNPWQVFRDERYIGNSRITPCNKLLKRRVLENKLHEEEFDNERIILVFGISGDEDYRGKRISEGWRRKNIYTKFPLLENPIYYGQGYEEFERKYNLISPRLYKLGFKHNNCGGACVKAGIKQWIHLYDNFPNIYLWHEEQEKITRQLLQKDVSILRDRNGGITKPLTLEALRRRIE